MDEQRNYELAYHVNPTVEETKLTDIKMGLEKMITDAGGVIAFSQAPEKKHLSYPIDHQSQSFFGWAQFSLPRGELAEGQTDPLAVLDEYLRLNTDIMRHVILKLEVESEKQAAKAQARIDRAKQRASKEAAKEKETPKEEKRGGVIEKQLEDILGNL